MPIILLDQDGPLAWFDRAVHRVLDEHGYDSSALVRTEWETTNDVARCFGAEAAGIVDRARHSAGFYRDLEPVEGAVEGVQNLLDAGCELIVCTAPSLENPSCASDKIAWIAEHFPALRRHFVITKDKTLVRGHVLLDDKPEVKGTLPPTWAHVRFDTPGNAHVTHGEVMLGWDHWADLLARAREIESGGR